MQLAELTYFMTLFALMALLAAAGLSDARAYHISNRLTLAVLALYPLHAIAGHFAGWIVVWWLPLSALGGMTLVGLLLFQRGWLAGGDIKLLIGLSPWIGVARMPDFLIITALAGGAVAMAALAQRLLERRFSTNGQAPALRETPIPYGIAIMCGGFYTSGQLILNALQQ